MTWRGMALACAIAWCGGAHAAQAATDVPLEPRAGAPLRDRDFGVQVRGFGLDRRVEMLQWQRVNGQYRRVWHDARIDARAHDRAHRNPRLPLRGRRWWSDTAHLDRRPIDLAVLQALGTWKTMRPDFAALPGTLAAKYQPEGDGLGSAENPLEPRIGDVRITWRELELPPLEGRIEQRRGTWQLRDVAPVAVAPSPLDPVSPPATAILKAPLRANAPSTSRLWPLPWSWTSIAAAMGAAIVIGLVVSFKRKRRARRKR